MPGFCNFRFECFCGLQFCSPCEVLSSDTGTGNAPQSTIQQPTCPWTHGCMHVFAWHLPFHIPHSHYRHVYTCTGTPPDCRLKVVGFVYNVFNLRILHIISHTQHSNISLRGYFTIFCFSDHCTMKPFETAIYLL